MHVQFNFIIWILLQLGVDHVFLNPIPYLIGSVWPDCDIKYSLVGKIFPFWIVSKHRGITHSLVGLVTFSSLVCLYDVKWGILFAAGYLLHLLEDSSTPMGVKWMFGHKKRSY